MTRDATECSGVQSKILSLSSGNANSVLLSAWMSLQVAAVTLGYQYVSQYQC